MKLYSGLLLLTISLWSSPIFAEYCTVSKSGTNLCRFSIAAGTANKASIMISYTNKGWSIMVAAFVDDWVMIEGDARIKIGKGEVQTIKHLITHKDIVDGGGLMEAAVYAVSEDMLHEIADSSGSVRLWLPALESEERKVKVWSGRFSKLNEFIAETKSVLGL